MKVIMGVLFFISAVCMGLSVPISVIYAIYHFANDMTFASALWEGAKMWIITGPVAFVPFIISYVYIQVSE